MKRILFFTGILVALCVSAFSNEKAESPLSPLVRVSPVVSETLSSRQQIQDYVDAVEFQPGRSSLGGRSFGSSGFKSIKQLSLPNRSTSVPQTRSGSSGGTSYYSPSPMVFFWFPSPGNTIAPEGAGSGWFLLLIVVGAVVIAIVVSRRKSLASGVEKEEEDELKMLLDRCEKNLNYLTDRYVEAASWLERLEGKIPAAEWKAFNQKYAQIRTDDFTKQLETIKAHLSAGEDSVARTLLYSFDDDAVAVFEFLQEIEDKLEEVSQ